MKTDLKLVQSAIRRPHRCALIPFIGQNHPKGFIDTGTDFWGERVYLSVIGVEQCAQLLGWHPPTALRDAEKRAAAERAARERVEAERDELRAQLEAVGVLKAAGYTAQRKPGRKPADKAVA